MGKATIADRGTQRPIYVGDGMIPQIERFASKASVNEITINTLRTVIADMVSKADNPTGNHFIFVVNEAFWYQVQRVLDKYLADRHTDGCHLWSKGSNSYLKVGATFDSYEWAK